MKRFAKIIIAVLVLVSIISFVLAKFAHSVPASVRKVKIKDTPHLFFDNAERIGEITDYAVCGKYLYLLYANKSVLDCYSINGSYVCSYLLDLGKKGAASLHVKKEILYVQSRELTFYSFSQGNYLEKTQIDASNFYSFIKAMDDHYLNSEEFSYERRGSSIWKINNNGCEIVLERSAWLSIFQGWRLLVVGPLCIICAALILSRTKDGFLP